MEYKKLYKNLSVHGVLLLSVGIRFESVRVYDAFVEDESIAFGASDDS